MDLSLKFEIRDLLIATALIALSSLAFRFYREGHIKSREIAAARQELAQKKSDLRVNEIRIEGAAAKFDYYRQVDSIHQAATQAFEKLKPKYSVVQPKHGKISYRYLPTLIDNAGQSKVHYRISVPAQSPVFLRWGVTQAQPPESSLDQHDWLPAERVNSWKPGELQLEPGLHDIAIITNRDSIITNRDFDGDTAWIEVRLNDSVVINADTTLEGQRAGSSWMSPRNQRDFSFDKVGSKKHPNLSQLLGSIDFRSSDDQPDREFFLWLSGTPMPDVFSSDRSEGNSND